MTNQLPDENAKRILVIGDAGRGKSTLAKNLCQKLNIPCYSMDDFSWIIKFSEKQDREKSIKNIKEQVYSKDTWIVEGTANYLIKPGLERADYIIHLGFQNVLSQWWMMIKCHQIRSDQTIFNLLKLQRHVFYKRHGLGYLKRNPKMLKLIEPYKDKVVFLYSFKEVDNFLKKIKT